MKPVRVTAHFGEWIQGRMGREGPVVLVTLLCPALATTAPAKERASKPLFSDQALDGFAKTLGLDLPLPAVSRNFTAGMGAGASTATLVAMARAAGYTGGAQQLAQACLDVEGATDPLMFDAPDTLLWASRKGRALRNLTAPPVCEIVGGTWGDTLVTTPGDRAFDDVTDLVQGWARAADAGDLPRLAELASASAHRCTARRGPDDPMADLCRDSGALGHMRAHTGSARGLIFAPGQVPHDTEDRLMEAGLKNILRFTTGGT